MTRASIIATIVTIQTCSAFADGLVYQLPKDGNWAQYAATVEHSRNGETRTYTGDLRIASVGEATEQGKTCRWIEVSMAIEMGDRSRLIVAKLLIPEAELKAGGDPLANRIRGWIRMGADKDVVDLTDNQLGPLNVWLAPALKDAKTLEPAEVDSVLGRKQCDGVSGVVTFTEFGNETKAVMEVRTHRDAPFGSVSASVDVDVRRNNDSVQTAEMKFKLSEVGTDAKTKLPDHN